MTIAEHFMDSDHPASAPETAIARMICLRMEMPPYSAAKGLLPVARIS